MDIEKANNLYDNLSMENYEDIEVINACMKFEECTSIIENLPLRLFYSFNGDICTLPNSYDDEVICEFVSGGAFHKDHIL